MLKVMGVWKNVTMSSNKFSVSRKIRIIGYCCIYYANKHKIETSVKISIAVDVFKVKRKVKIRNQPNQVPYLAQGLEVMNFD